MDVKPHDLTLLSHELKEISLVNQGLSQHEAHIEAAREFPYGRECQEYYEKLEEQDKSKGKEHYSSHNSGAISIDDYEYDER